MTQEIVARFQLHLRCECCAKETMQHLDVPNVERAPRTVDELTSSGMLDFVAYKCASCESEIANLLAIVPFIHKDAAEMTKRPMADEGRLTMFVVCGFLPGKGGGLVSDQPFQASSADAARRRAQRYADAGGGAIATSQGGNPVTGDWDEPEVLARVGRLPDEEMVA